MQKNRLKENFNIKSITSVGKFISNVLISEIIKFFNSWLIQLLKIAKLYLNN